jgi:hypothetical protein
VSDLSAQHYLEIYRFRVECADKGLTHAKPQVVSAARRLVAKLAEMSPEKKVRLEIEGSGTVFKNAETGEVIGRFEV